jgi:hypothetical protein
MSYVTFDGSKLVSSDRKLVSSVVVRATTDTILDIIDGVDGSGQNIIPVGVKAGETFAMSGRIAFNSGVYVNAVSGTFKASIAFE